MTVIVYHMLNNVEKEKLVIDLYYNQQKNVCQIAQVLAMHLTANSSAHTITLGKLLDNIIVLTKNIFILISILLNQI